MPSFHNGAVEIAYLDEGEGDPILLVHGFASSKNVNWVYPTWVSELKKNPMGTVAAGEGFPVAILNRNEPAFYCVPANAWEVIMERLDDLELNALADARAGQPVIRVDPDAL